MKRAIIFAALFLAGCADSPAEQAKYSGKIAELHSSMVNGVKRALPGYTEVSIMGHSNNPDETFGGGVNPDEAAYYSQFILLRRNGEDYVAHIYYAGLNQVHVQDIEKLTTKHEQCHEEPVYANGSVNHYENVCDRVYDK